MRRFILSTFSLICTSVAFASGNAVSIRGGDFFLNGRPTYEGRVWNGHRVEGLLLNNRVVQGTFDDLNPETVSRWVYPDTGKWDPERNIREFLAAMPEWKAHGVLAFTVNFQGGSPEGYSKGQPWENHPFNPDGTLRPAFMDRMKRILDEADRLGMVPIVGYFYFGQSGRLQTDENAIRATDTLTKWLLDGGWKNLLIEINNESNAGYRPPILRANRVHELIARVRAMTAADGHRLLVGTSFPGEVMPTLAVVRASDFVLLHGNGFPNSAALIAKVHATRALDPARVIPVLINEDDHNDFDAPDGRLAACVGDHVSWGWFDWRRRGEGFDEGYQCVPVNWGGSSVRKRAFYAETAEISGARSNTPALDAPTTFHNPIVPGFAPDPSICRVGDDYYLANSSFTMYPGVPIYHSRDLISWRLVTYALSRPDQLELGDAGTQSGVWAPTLRYHDGTFHMIVKNQAIKEHLYVSSPSIVGPWSQPIIIEHWGEGIDPDLFFDADGKAYVTKTEEIDNNTVFRCWEIDLATGKLLSEPRIVWGGCTGQFEEGPHFYRIGEYYYQLLAEGGTWNNHQVTIARRPVSAGLGHQPSDWEACPRNPILFNDPARNPEINCTGHADLVQDQRGKWWIVFLGNRRTPKPDLGRETYLAPVGWKDGWPVVNDGKLITRELVAETLPAQPWPAPAVRDEFTNAALGLEWNFLRNPKEGTWSLSEKPGWLTLHGMPGVLADRTPLAWVGRRLRDKQACVTTRLDFAPAATGLAAGLDIFSQTADHAELIVRRSGSARQVAVRYRSSRDVALAELPGTAPVLLQLLLQNEELFFRYSTDEGRTWQTLIDSPIDQVVGYPGFAGIYVAMHATGAGATGYFDWCDYEPLAQPISAAHAQQKAALLDRDGFKRMEAEDFDRRSGTDIESCREGGLDVCRIRNGHWLNFDGVTFAKAPTTFVARVSSQTDGGKIEVRLDGFDGVLLGTCEVPGTKDWQEWTTVQCPLTAAPAGQHRICLRFTGAERRSLLNVNWFQFSADGNPAVNTTSSPRR